MTFDELWGHSTPNSWARVPRGPLAVGVGTFLFGATATAFTVAGTAVTWGTIAGFLITTAVTSWALTALGPRPPTSPTRNALGNVKEATGDFDIVYGTVRKGGVITFLESTDRVSNGNTYEDDYLHMVIVLAGHEVDAITDIYLNDEIVTIDSSGYVTSDRWTDGSVRLIRIKRHLGTPDQLADPDLVAETSADSNFRGRGIAYLYVRMDWEKGVFADGVPTITARVRGKKVWDPRTSTFRWTDNAALCIRDYVSEDYGVNSKQSPSSLSSPTWVTAANVCELSVPLAGGGSQPRYTLNGIVSTGQTPRDNLQRMLTSCGGTLFWGQGMWQFKAGYFPSGPYTSFTADDLRSGIDLVTKNSRKENFNEVTGVFVNAAQDYIEAEYPKVRSPVFLARDNGQSNVLDMSLPYTTNAPAAQRLGKMAMFRSREEIVLAADFGLKAANVMVGDVIQFTFSRYGFLNKFFEVVSWKPVVESGELKINMVLKETSAAAYDWNAEEAAIIGNNTNLPSPLNGLLITGLEVTNRQVLQSDGSLLGEVLLSWNRARSAFVDKYTVQWRRNTDVNWSATETDETAIVIPSVQSNVPYTYRVRAVTAAGFVGPWEQIGATVPGKNSAPGVPTGVTATGEYRAIEVKWTNPSDRDLNHVRVYASPDSNVANAVQVGRVNGTNFIHNLPPKTIRWYFLRSVDHSGNLSPFTTPGRQATALFFGNSDLEDVNVRELMRNAGLSGVDIVGSLPTTGNYIGRTVFLTTDNQLYIWNGTQWNKSVDAEVGLLELNNFPNNIRPLEIVSTLPTTNLFNGRMVFLLNDGRIHRVVGGQWTTSTAAADISGTITSTQIGPNAIDTPQLNANAVNAAKINSNSIDTRHILTDAITAGKIQAGAITADKIQANSIGASKLVISDMTNLVPDSDFMDPATWANQNPTQFFIETSGPSFRSTNWVRSPLNGDNTGSFISKRFSVEVGEEYYCAIQARKNGSAQNVEMWARLVFYDQSGTALLTRTLHNGPVTIYAENYTVSAIAPTGAVTATILWSFNAASSGLAYVGGPSVRRKSNGTLIVDGSILAKHITANTITAGLIDSGAIQTRHVEAGAILASKIDVDELSSISADLGVITGGSLSIGPQGSPANFIVNSSGQVTIRSSDTGARLVINNNRIDVRDAAGVLRVRIGEL